MVHADDSGHGSPVQAVPCGHIPAVFIRFIQHFQKFRALFVAVPFEEPVAVHAAQRKAEGNGHMQTVLLPPLLEGAAGGKGEISVAGRIDADSGTIGDGAALFADHRADHAAAVNNRVGHRAVGAIAHASGLQHIVDGELGVDGMGMDAISIDDVDLAGAAGCGAEFQQIVNELLMNARALTAVGVQPVHGHPRHGADSAPGKRGALQQHHVRTHASRRRPARRSCRFQHSEARLSPHSSSKS